MLSWTCNEQQGSLQARTQRVALPASRPASPSRHSTLAHPTSVIPPHVPPWPHIPPHLLSPSLSPRLRTGTSQAVPFVAGVIALILQNSTRTSPADMSQLLAASAAKGKLSEVPTSSFASWDKVRCLAVIRS